MRTTTSLFISAAWLIHGVFAAEPHPHTVLLTHPVQVGAMLLVPPNSAEAIPTGAVAVKNELPNSQPLQFYAYKISYSNGTSLDDTCAGTTRSALFTVKSPQAYSLPNGSSLYLVPSQLPNSSSHTLTFTPSCVFVITYTTPDPGQSIYKTSYGRSPTFELVDCTDNNIDNCKTNTSMKSYVSSS